MGFGTFGRVGAWVTRGMAVALCGVAMTLPGAARAQGLTFKHIIIVIQENRTPDNLFGSNPTFEPGVDLATSGKTSTGATVQLFAQPINTCYDQAHGYPNFKAQYTEGADKVPPETKPGCTAPPLAAYTYVDNSTGQIQPYFDIAMNYGWANDMFQTNEGPSFPAHLMLFDGTTSISTESSMLVSGNPAHTRHGNGCIGPSNNTVSVVNSSGKTVSPVYPCFTTPTLGDILDAHGLSWRYYGASTGSLWFAPTSSQDLCVPQTVGGTLQCTGPDYSNGTMVTPQPAQILTDIANCNLAAVSWVTPTPEASDHGTETNGSGPSWVASIVNAVGKQATCPDNEHYWFNTAIFVTWDDWGGYFDHVPPFAVNAQPAPQQMWGQGNTYGFRVPLLVVSAYTPAGTVDNVNHDFGSLLYFTEQSFGLPFIGPGDTPYSQYADYQAYARGDDLSGFFTLKTPRKFTPINAPLNASYFLAQPPAKEAPDQDE